MGAHASKPFKCSKRSDLEKAEVGELAARGESLKRLQNSIQSLVEENKYSDLLVVCGNDQYPCHRAVVCMRSTYFRSKCEEVERKWNRPLPIINLGLDGEYTHVIAAVMTYLYTLDYAQSNQSLAFGLPPEMQSMSLTEGEDNGKNSEIETASSTYDLLDDVMENDVQTVTAEEQIESQEQPFHLAEVLKDDHNGVVQTKDPGLTPVELVFHAQVCCASVVLGIPCLAKLAQQKFLRRLYSSKISNYELLTAIVEVYQPRREFARLCDIGRTLHEQLKPHFQTMRIELVQVLHERWTQIKGDSLLEAAVIECPEFGKDLLRLL